MTEKKEETRLAKSIRANGKGLVLQSIEDMYRFAECVVQSQLAPSGFKTPQQVLIAIQSGAELAMPPMRSLQSLCVVNGQARLWGDAPLALVRQSGLLEYIKEWIEGENENMVAHCETKRKGDPEAKHTTFSVEDAKDARLWAKAGTWQQYPKRMLTYRARSFNLRDNFPDCFGGATIAEEYEGVEIPESAHEPDAPRRDERQSLPEPTSDQLMQSAILGVYNKFKDRTGKDDVETFCEFVAFGIGGDPQDYWRFDDDVAKAINPEAFTVEMLQNISKALDNYEVPVEAAPEPEAEPAPEPATYSCKRCKKEFAEMPKNGKCDCLGKVVENEPVGS